MAGVERTKPIVSPERVKERLIYDPDTGEFVWRTSIGGRGKAGNVAGNFRKSDGYMQVWLEGRLYLSHVLAWAYMTGEWPEGEVDHENLNRSDNRWGNLRSASHSQNQANSTLYKNNTSGFRGVCRKGGKWVATIRKDGKGKYLGTFNAPEEAYSRYVEESIRLHGDFSPYAK